MSDLQARGAINALEDYYMFTHSLVGPVGLGSAEESPAQLPPSAELDEYEADGDLLRVLFGKLEILVKMRRQDARQLRAAILIPGGVPVQVEEEGVVDDDAGDQMGPQGGVPIRDKTIADIIAEEKKLAEIPRISALVEVLVDYVRVLGDLEEAAAAAGPAVNGVFGWGEFQAKKEHLGIGFERMKVLIDRRTEILRQLIRSVQARWGGAGSSQGAGSSAGSS